MKKNLLKKNKGFTILETLIAVLLLSLVLNSVFSLISGTLFSAQYAKNDMIASYLLQESADYIRNTRDTQARVDVVNGWASFLSLYDLGNPNANNPQTRVCKLKINPTSFTSPVCDQVNGSSPEQIYYYKDTYLGSYYSTENVSVSGKEVTTFTRLVKLSKNNHGDEVDASITISWKNGLNLKSKTYNISFTDWQTN